MNQLTEANSAIKKLARVILLDEDGAGFTHVALIKSIIGGRESWDFPGDEIKVSETPEKACERIALEQLGIISSPKKLFARVTSSGSPQLEENFFIVTGGTGGNFGTGKGLLPNQKAEPVIVNLLLSYEIGSKEIRDRLCKSFPNHIHIADHKRIVDEVSTIAMKEMGMISGRIDTNEQAAFKERGDLNLLMFGIVGTVLTFNKDVIKSPIALLGMVVLISISTHSYLRVRKQREVRYFNHQSFLDEMDKRFRACLDAYNEFAGSLNSYTEQLWQKATVEFKTWKPEKDVKTKPEPRFLSKDSYFFWLGLGICLIGTGFLLIKWINWHTMVVNLGFNF